MIAAVAGVLAALSLASASKAAEACALCDTEIVTNSALATCFLDEYQQFAGKTEGAIVVDLTNCAEESRGVIEPLAAPGLEVQEPDTHFMVSRAQLDCLKRKLEQPDLVLDPSAKIELDSCG